MGSLTELVIAALTEAEDVAQPSPPADHRRRMNADGLDQAKLSTLRSIITNREYEDGWIDDFRFLAGNQEEGPWVFSVPDMLINGLAGFPENRLKAVAKQWFRTEEFQTDDWTMEAVESRLRELYRFFQEAKQAKKPVLMYISLKLTSRL